jgi:hypothetical protein
MPVYAAARIGLGSSSDPRSCEEAARDTPAMHRTVASSPGGARPGTCGLPHSLELRHGATPWSRRPSGRSRRGRSPRRGLLGAKRHPQLLHARGVPAIISQPPSSPGASLFSTQSPVGGDCLGTPPPGDQRPHRQLHPSKHRYLAQLQAGASSPHACIKTPATQPHPGRHVPVGHVRRPSRPRARAGSRACRQQELWPDDAHPSDEPASARSTSYMTSIV